MEPFPQLTSAAQSSNAHISLKIDQLSNEYIAFRTSLNLSQAELMNLNLFKLAVSNLQRFICGMSLLSNAGARLTNQKKISGILNGLEGFFQYENQDFVAPPQTSDQYTKILELYREIKEMLRLANLLVPQAAVTSHNEDKRFMETAAPARKQC